MCRLMQTYNPQAFIKTWRDFCGRTWSLVLYISNCLVGHLSDKQYIWWINITPYQTKRQVSHFDWRVKNNVTIWASYQIRNIAGCACAGNAGNVFPRRRFQRKPLVSDPGMHHGTCVTHVPWCMSGSLACSDGENVPGIPGACAPAILRIW